jgi:uncharacterized YccA/Bax inhibitor family protein
MADTNKTSNHFMGSNPIIRKLSKIDEYSQGDVCSYKGIALKLALFLLFTALGAALCVFLKVTGGFGGELIHRGPMYEDGQDVLIYSNEMIFLAAAGIVSFVAPLLATFIKATIPVTGNLFCASIGFVLCWLAMTFADIYLAPVLLALVITLILVFTMGFLYGMGIITVTQKVRTFIITAMITVCVGSLLVLIASFIPFTSGLVAQLAANPVLSIGVSALMVVIGTLFLLVDFDTIHECVEKGLPKKYEWYASFGLAFSVIWLYLKVLELVLKVMGRKK